MMRRFLTLGLSLLFLTSCSAMETLVLLSPDGSKHVALRVEMADEPGEREQGLMDREALPPEQGMFFAFPNPQILVFWMQNTKIPLDILFFDQNGEFVSAATMQPCTLDPCPKYRSAGAAQYALEVNRNFRRDHGIGVGWKLDTNQVQKIVSPK